MKPDNNSLHDWAVYYAQKGWAVFPLLPNSKKPATQHGFNDATTSVARVESWWRIHPDYNIGVATGKKSNGLVVIDLDIDEEKGKDGYHELQQWQKENKTVLPDTIQSITGRGGNHMFYHSDTPGTCSTSETGVDIRADGGYVVVPPSIHPNGRRYEWEQEPGDYILQETNTAVQQFIRWSQSDHIDRSEEKKQKELPEITLDDKDKIEQALSIIPAKELTYDEWIHLGMALYNCGMPFESFDKWSKDDSRYDGTEETFIKWQSFTGTKSRWNMGTIFNIEKRFHADRTSQSHHHAATVVTVKDGKTVLKVDPAAELQVAEAVEEQGTEWLIPDIMPRHQITTLAGDGGSGKTTIECAVTAAVTTGKNCFMTADIIPEDFTAEPENVLFLSAEDDFARVLKRKLRIAGADLKRVFTLPISAESFSKVKFGSDELKRLIEACRPGLVIFDPIQAFVPPDIQMGWRNAMRQCLSPLIGYGEQYGASFLIICHTNKQQGVYGRKRIADSADIWDISRSVLIVGDTGEGNMKYMSHEKSNYGGLQKTILYTLDGEQVVYQGRSDLKDADYIRKDRLPRSAPARAEAKEIIIETLKENNGQMKASDLDSVLIGQGVSVGTLKRAKSELKRSKTIRYWKDGFGSEEWFTSLIQSECDTE